MDKITVHTNAMPAGIPSWGWFERKTSKETIGYWSTEYGFKIEPCDIATDDEIAEMKQWLIDRTR